MLVPNVAATALAWAAAVGSAAAVTIAEINGNRFLSPLQNTTVTDVRGLVTAIASNGIFLRSTEPDDDPATSEGLFVFGTAVRSQVAVGDIITLDGRVVEYRHVRPMHHGAFTHEEAGGARALTGESSALGPTTTTRT